MEFRILGPLEVTAAGKPLPLGGPRQRAVLTLLLLNANEVVSRSRLIEDVWGEEAPAEVDASLRVYVARLRKLLAAGNGTGPTLETRRNGYVLRVAPETVDLNRFVTLLASGSDRLAAGNAAEASAELSEALRLWRGPALADLADESWARREGVRLDELRLRALEARIEADLAAGRHADVVAELEALVADDPCREGFVRQLMLALYRCGRQHDALQAYADARRALAEGFGLEPTRALRELERQILLQDPALDPLPQPVADSPRVAARRRGRLLVPAAAVLALLVAATLVIRDRAESAAVPIALAGDSVVVIDPKTSAVVSEVALGGRPSGIAVGFGSVWVGNVDDKTLLRIDPRTREIVETIGLGAEPRAIAVGGGNLWVLSRAANAVLEVDPGINDVVATIDLRTTSSFESASQIVFARRAVWVALFPAGKLLRIDPKAQSVVVRPGNVRAIASTGRSLWGVIGWQTDRIRRLDPPGETIRFEWLDSSAGLGGLVANDDAVWTGTLANRATLWRIDPDLGRVTASIPLRHPVGTVTLGERAMWVMTRDGYVLRVDPEAGRVVRTIALGLYPPSLPDTIAAGEGGVWVAALAR